MTTQETLQDLTFRSTRIEMSLALLKADLRQLHKRLDEPETEPSVVTEDLRAMAATAFDGGRRPPQQLPAAGPTAATEPPVLPPLPEPAPTPMREPEPADRPGFELQFGRWLARIGVVFALLTLIYFSVVVHDKIWGHLGPWSKLSILALASIGLIAAGLRLEARDRKLLIYGRTLAGGGLACLYYTLYGAIYVPQLQVIGSPLFGGFLLLAWSATVLWLAERRKSELLSVFAIALAYFSSTITPGNGFVMSADLIIAATAVVFLVRNAWTGLPYLCLIGTYAGFLRQAVDYRGPFDFAWTGVLPFGPSAVYLTGAWVIFTTGILLSRAPQFAGGKRMAFLCLNNGAWTGLLLVAAKLGSFHHLGAVLIATGLAQLAAWALAKILRHDETDIAGAYLAQGLGCTTAGFAIGYRGITRGLLLTIESVFLVAAGAYSRNVILRLGGGIASLLGAAFLAVEIVDTTVHPWLLTSLGTVALLVNAWLARRERWNAPREVAARWMPEPVLHVVLALGVLGAGIFFHSPDHAIAPRFALATLVLTASIYVVPLVELPVLAQLLLAVAQLQFFADALFNGSEGWFSMSPQGTRNVVAGVTLVLATWWPRQTHVRTRGWWLSLLTAWYALGLVACCYASLHVRNHEQTWMIEAALLSLVFLAYGAWSRLWAFALAGQLLLAMSVFTFLNGVGDYQFPWTWWAAAVPIGTVFATGWIGREVLPRYASVGETIRLVARIYQSIAIGLLVRWVFGIAPAVEITLVLMAFGTAFVGAGLALRSSYAIRAGLVLDACGVAHYYTSWPGTPYQSFTWLDATALVLLLAQPAMLRHWGRELISHVESWVLIGVSSVAGWSLVSNAVVNSQTHNLTLAWALYAVALIVAGFVATERRQRWCGLAILAAAFVRVGVHDVWGYSDVYKVLTLLALTVICLGLSFLYYKFADRLKEWL